MNNMSFSLFLALWNKVQGQTTPSVHFRIARWLERAWGRQDRRLLLMAFRSCGKSTIVGLFAAWLLYRQPNLRILVLAADDRLARKMVRNVKRIIERHQATASLRPKQLDQWASDRFTINRPLELRDPSMLGRGISANMTGSRADVIICDDVEVPNTCATADSRAELRERLAEVEFVLTPGGTQLYVGTPHSWFTIYADQPRTEIGEVKPFLDGFRRLVVPIVGPEGSAWPERFPMAEIESMRKRSGPNRFNSQMLLQPVNIAEGRLDPAQLVRYSGEIERDPVFRTALLNGKTLVSGSAWWDPAFGRGSGDASVLAIVFTDEDGRQYLHHLKYLKVPPAESDEAAAQCRMVAEAARQFALPAVALEINGIGRFLPAILRQEMAKARVPCAVREVHSTKSKSLRIMEAFDVVLAARLLHVHAGVYATPFIAEMQEWRPGRVGGRDDGIDAVAGALSLEPVRLKRSSSTGARQHIARSEFEI